MHLGLGMQHGRPLSLRLKPDREVAEKFGNYGDRQLLYPRYRQVPLLLQVHRNRHQELRL